MVFYCGTKFDYGFLGYTLDTCDVEICGFSVSVHLSGFPALRVRTRPTTMQLFSILWTHAKNDELVDIISRLF